MTKEELEKEAIEYTQKLGVKDFIAKPKEIVAYFGYLAGAEPREKRIADLEKENAELKNRDCWKSCEYANPKAELIGQHIKDVQNLTKAKELIEDMYNAIPSSHSDYYKDVMERARQFFSEVEK